MTTSLRKRVFVLCAPLLFISTALAAEPTLGPPTLDSGFRLMYNLEFDRAHKLFADWQRQHPDNPMGPASDASGLLFSELHRLGVLEAQFFENDKAFDARKEQTPDPVLHDRFNAALEQAEQRAQVRLAKNPNDRDGLFAMTLSAGLKADYAALVEKRNLASLGYTKDASRWAEKLLAAEPNCYDAYLAMGIGKYIIGSMAAPVRWFLKLGGYSGDKKAGLEELKKTAEHGQYLGPFARILLAIAYVRDKDKPKAREILSSLRDEFPNNPLFTREIARLDTGKN